MLSTQYPIFSLSKEQVSKAGKVLIGTAGVEDKIDAFEILEQWCALHAYPLEFYRDQIGEQINLLKKNDEYIIAQRIKRVPSIFQKLKRFPDMQLGRVQDIGGLRIIVPEISDIAIVKRQLLNSLQIKGFRKEYDYIALPKDSGYRSCHLIYRFDDPDSPKEYRGLHIECQVRTKIQHAWATSLETFAVFLDRPLKSSSGPAEYLFFFEMASAAFARLENSPVHKKFQDLSMNDLVRQIFQLEQKLSVREKLISFSNTMTVTKQDNMKGNYVILNMSPKRQTVDILTCREITEAHQSYIRMEQEKKPDENIVLVAVSSIGKLVEAYPNYFANTSKFLILLNGLFEKFLG